MAWVQKATGIILIKRLDRYDFCSDDCLKAWANKSHVERQQWWRKSANPG